jgi:probable phosphoglycerate mutase
VRLIVEADGGSRGNPGVAAYGVVVRDAANGRALARRGSYLGDAVTNNIAEYSGLIAGLRAAAEADPAAEVEVRMDSKLVVSQMTGVWKIKDQTLQRLAAEAREAQGSRRVKYTWVPRERNQAADALANEAMDTRGEVSRGPTKTSVPTSDAAGPAGGSAAGQTAPGKGAPARRKLSETSVPMSAAAQPGGESGAGVTASDKGHPAPAEPAQGNAAKKTRVAAVNPGPAALPPDAGAMAAGVKAAQRVASGSQRHIGNRAPITTLILVRHGMTADTSRDVFAGGSLEGPPLSPAGEAQAEAAALELERMAAVPWFELERPTVLLSSPTARTLGTAKHFERVFGLETAVDPGFAEEDFGEWDGLAKDQVEARWPGAAAAWYEDGAYTPPGGESRLMLFDRLRSAVERVVAAHRGATVVAVSHALATRAAIGVALGAPEPAWSSFRVAPASITVLRFWDRGNVEIICTNRTVAWAAP